MEHIKGGLGLTAAEVDAIMMDLTGAAAPSAAATTVTPTAQQQQQQQAQQPGVIQSSRGPAMLAIAAQLDKQPSKLVTVSAPKPAASPVKTIDTTSPLRPAPPAVSAAKQKAPLTSVATGAITGMLVGGPAGALVGAAAGWWLGAAAAKKGLPQK